jgi:VWFA-related protein
MRYYLFLTKRQMVGRLLSLLLTSALFLSLLAVQGQEKKQTKKTGEDEDVIKISSNLVSLDVVVKDKKGKFVTDLKPEDFTVSENGVPQRIEFFDSTLSSERSAGQPATTVGSPEPKPENTSGLPRNIIALVLDGQSTELANLKHVREGVEKYIRERISDSDSVALFSISGGLQLLQSFTHDKARLIAAVDKAYSSSNVSKTSEARSLAQDISSLRNKISTGAPTEVASSPAGGAAGSAAAETLIAQHVLEQYMQLRSALSAQQTRPVLAALAAIAEGLRPVPGKKTLVMFSEGFVAPETLDWQVQSTIDIANRANVAIYIIDASGLTGGTPTSGALVAASPLAGISGGNSMESRRRVGGGESVFDITRQEGLNRQQDLLYKISEDTGGRFIKNTNDIALGLDRIDSEIRSRYTLAYRSTDANFDGSFRKVKIEVRRPDTNVVGRPGYYAIPASQIVPISPEDQKLLANFSSMLAHSTLPLAMELSPFRSQEGYYTVPLSFEIPQTAVQFDRKGDKQRLQLEVLAVVRNEGEDRILSRLGGNFDVALSPQQYESIINDKIFYRQDMQLEVGNYTVDLIVRDRLSGKVAARRERLVLPAAGPEFWTTDALLSRRAETLKEATTSADVLSEGNVRVRPSPSREFQANDNLILFFKLYNAAISHEIGKPLVRVTVTLMKDGKPARRPLDYQLTEPQAEPVPHLTFAKYIKLTGLAPGNYSALIESRDIVQQKVAKQEAKFQIVP